MATGRPTGPADLREAAYQKKLTENAAALAAKPKRVRKPTEPVLIAGTAPANRTGKRTAIVAATAAGITKFGVDNVKVVGPDAANITREAWMLAAVEAMRPWFVEVGSEVGPVRISVGWAGGRSAKGKGIRGQCWASHTVSDRIPAIFVTPDQFEPITILGIILHEMGHAADDGLSGHRGAFAKVAKALGFIAPWTSSEGKTPELVERLTALYADLGPFPHSPIGDKSHGLTGLGIGRPPVQTTRMLKLECPTDGYLVRTTQKWIEVGLPSCPDGHGMEIA